jgi:nucleotide-binding universal stress UspA family protein
MCITDLSEFSNIAINYGISLAKEFESRLYLCHIADIPSITFYADTSLDPIQLQNRIMNSAHEHFERILGQEEALSWEPLISVGNAVSEITRLVKDKAVDLTICASYGRTGLKRLMLGSVTENLMRTIPCPLLVIRNPERVAEKAESTEFRFERILVGCDFSSHASVALTCGVSLAQEFQSELHLAHVMEPPAYKELLKTNAEVETRYYAELKELLSQKLDNLVPLDARNWCTPKTVMLEGNPHEKLIEYAKQINSDLIVLGVRGLGLVKSIMVGSTTDRVIRQAPCPVLSVHPIA